MKWIKRKIKWYILDVIIDAYAFNTRGFRTMIQNDCDSNKGGYNV